MSSIELDSHDFNENDPLLGDYADQEEGESNGWEETNAEDQGIVARAGAITILGSVLNAGRDINLSTNVGERLLDDTSSRGQPVSSEVRRRRREVWNKIDKRVLPLVLFFQLAATLNRPRMMSASRNDRFALAVTYAPYIIAKLPCNLLLKAVGPNLLLPTLVALCGLFTVIQAWVTSYTLQLGCWFFLGLFQGGIFSSIVLYLSSFYPRHKLTARIFTSSPIFLAAHLSIFIAGTERTEDDSAWQWMLLVEGILTIIFGTFSFWILPQSPEHCEFLDSEEKAYVEHTLAECGSTGDEGSDIFSWRGVGKAPKSPQVLLVAIVFFFNGTLLATLSHLTPSIVGGLKAGRFAPLFFMAPVISAFAVTLTSAYICDRFSAHGPISMFSGLIAMVGFVMCYTTTSKSVKYGSLFLTMSGACCAVPILLVWSANNSTPHIRRATAIAVGLVMSDLGGLLVIGRHSLVYKAKIVMMIVFSILIIIVSGVNVVYLYDQNKKKARIRTISSREEERADLGDKSAWFVYSL